MAPVENLQRDEIAQAEVIAQLVAAATERGDQQVGFRLGAQQLVEQRTVRLENAERLLRSVIGALEGALCIVGRDGTILDANPRWPSAVGSDFFAWCAGNADLGVVATDVAATVRALVEQGPDAPGDWPVSVKGRTGAPEANLWTLVRIHPVTDHPHARAVVSKIDITQGMRTQEDLHRATRDAQQLATALTQEKTLLSGVISAIPQLVYWKDGQGRYAGCNRAYRDLLGPQDQSGLRTRHPPAAPSGSVGAPGSCDTADAGDAAGADDDRAVLAALAALEEQVLRTGAAVLDRTVDVPGRSGSARTFLLSVLPLDLEPDQHVGSAAPAAGRGLIGVGADISHVRELERQLAQSSRLESIGELAAGIAHEINTPVQFVTDNTRFVTDSVRELLSAFTALRAAIERGDPPTQFRAIADGVDLDLLNTELPAALGDSLEGLARVAQIVRAMKDYAHPGTAYSDVDINHAIESTVQVCRNEWKYVATTTLDLDPAAGTIPGYEGELKQVVLNMIVNAAQAIGDDPARQPASPPGVITITTRRTPDELLLTIADTGPGMPPEVRDRVFDPFFTTKPVGKGTGQGLTLAHAVVVTKHHGRIHLDTSPGHGTTFTLHLPLSHRDSTPDSTAPGPNADPRV